jgi:hypothetical protein
VGNREIVGVAGSQVNNQVVGNQEDNQEVSNHIHY